MKFYYDKLTKRKVLTKYIIILIWCFALGTYSMIYSLSSASADSDWLLQLIIVGLVLITAMTVKEAFWVLGEFEFSKQGITIKYPFFKEKCIKWDELKTCQIENNKMAEVINREFQNYKFCAIFSKYEANKILMMGSRFYHASYRAVCIYFAEDINEPKKAQLLDSNITAFTEKLDEWNVQIKDLRGE